MAANGSKMVGRPEICKNFGWLNQAGGSFDYARARRQQNRGHTHLYLNDARAGNMVVNRALL